MRAGGRENQQNTSRSHYSSRCCACTFPSALNARTRPPKTLPNIVISCLPPAPHSSTPAPSSTLLQDTPSPPLPSLAPRSSLLITVLAHPPQNPLTLFSSLPRFRPQSATAMQSQSQSHSVTLRHTQAHFPASHPVFPSHVPICHGNSSFHHGRHRASVTPTVSHYINWASWSGSLVPLS